MRSIALVCLLSLHPAAAAAWTPPIGIPAPTWPTAVDLPRPALPNPWTSDQPGFYFVSRTGCWDARVYGNPNAPRCTLPTTAAAGAVIVLNGVIPESRAIAYVGRPDSPIWIMGYDTGSRPSITEPWAIAGAYLILDSLSFNLSGQDGVALVGDYIMLRGSTLANPYGGANGSGFAITGRQIVFFNNVVSQMGNWLYDGPDLDRLGIKVLAEATDVWILDSAFYHCQSDGVQVGDQSNAASQINRIYIGRNVAYENLQFGFWVKNGTDVVFSENVVYRHHRTTPSGPGGGLGGQYDPRYVWFIMNRIYDNNSGIHIAGANSGTGGPWFAIGNVIHAIAAGSCNGYDFGAISYRNSGGLTVLFNTIADVDFFGGFPPSGGTVTLRNNIFASKRINACGAFFAERPVTHDYNLFSSAWYDIEGEPHRVVGDPLFVAPGSNFALLTGSPAIDRGNPAEESAFSLFQTRYGVDLRRDVTGSIRPQGAAWDIGAYEGPGAPRPPQNLRIIR